MKRNTRESIENLDFVKTENFNNAVEHFEFDDYILKIIYKLSQDKKTHNVTNRVLTKKDRTVNSNNIKEFRYKKVGLRLLHCLLLQSNYCLDSNGLDGFGFAIHPSYLSDLNKYFSNTGCTKKILESDGHRGIKFVGDVNPIYQSTSSMSSEDLSQYNNYGVSSKYYPFMNDIAKYLKPQKYYDDHPKPENAEFYVALSIISLSYSSRNRITTAEVFIPENPFVACENEQPNKCRNRMERYPNQIGAIHPASEEIQRFLKDRANNKDCSVSPFPARFSAGGSLTLLKTPTEKSFLEDSETDYKYEEFIIVAQKDAGANIHRHHLVPSSGISETEDAWTNPLLCVAVECAEEIRLRDRDDEKIWYKPHFNSQTAKHQAVKKYFNHLNLAVEDTIKLRQKHFSNYLSDSVQHTKCRNLPDKELGTRIPIEADFFDLGKDKLLIKSAEYGPNQKGFEYEGLLVIDEKYAAVDLMTTVILKSKKPLSHLLVLDGETFKKELLWRNVFVFEPKQFLNVFNGKEAEALYFGCDNGEWKNGEMVELPKELDINPPLLISGEALLIRRYPELGGITTRYEQKNKQEILKLRYLQNAN